MHKRFLTDLFGGMERGHILVWLYDGDKQKESHWFTGADAAANFIETVKSRRVNAYVGVGLSPQNYGKNRRCEKANIIGIGGLWADIDIQDAVHKKPNLPGSVEEAKKLLDALPYEPTYIIHSGHGLQAWFMFREPWTFDADEERAEAENLSKRLNYYLREKARAFGWDVDAVFNLDRVMRIPNTTNYKAAPVAVRVIERSGKKYNPADFDDFLPDAQTGAKTEQVARVTFELDASADPPFGKFQVLCEIEPKFKDSWDKKRPDFQDQSASAFDLSLARYAYMYAWTDQEVANLIIAFRRRHNQDLKLRRDYYENTLKRAKNGIKHADAIESIIAHGESRSPDDTEPIDENEKERLMQWLSEAFEVRIVQIARYVADPPIYKIKTAQGSITLGEVENLIGQNALRVKLAAATGRYLPKFKGERWDKIAQSLLDCCFDIEIGEEATEAGEMRAWLDEYLDNKPPYPYAECEEAQQTRFPFITKTGEIAIFGSDFRRWLRQAQQEKITSKRFGVIMRGIGADPQRVPVTVDGKDTTRNLWIVR